MEFFKLLKEKKRQKDLLNEGNQISVTHLLRLRDHQSYVFKIDMPPTTYRNMVSHKFNISDQKVESCT